MKIFRWLVVVTVVLGAIVGGIEIYFTLAMGPYGFAAGAGTSDTISASHLRGQTSFPMIFLAIEAASLLVALLSGVMFGVSGRRGWQIALWAAAIILLLPSALATYLHVLFFAPTILPAAVLMFLAALFSLGASGATGDTTGAADVERQPLIQPSSTLAPRHRRQLILGTAVALFGGATYIFVLPVSWVALLITLAVSSIGATLLISAPAAALVVPVAVWCGAVVANIVYGAANGWLADPIFWGGTLEFGGILIVIAVIPSLIGVAIGALLTRWLPGVSAS